MSDPLDLPHVRRLIGSLLENGRDHAVICMDAEGVIVAWLGGAPEIFGYTADEMVGSRFARIFTPDDRQKSLDQYELDVASANSRSEDERWHLRKDGTRIWATGTVNALRGSDGRVIGFVKVVRDRTDLRTQIESLENQLAGLREGQERTHLFLKTLGHELRNPLAPLATAAHIIGRLSDDPRVDSTLKIVARQIDVLSRLADDLLDVSRLEAGKLELRLQRLDLRNLLADMVVSLQATAADRGLTLTAILPDGPLELEADVPRLQQVILNLVGNAIKYTPEGGRIWVKATQEGPDIVCRVEDTGIGIAPAVLPRIFDLFTQERQAQDMEPGGLGVGLALVRRIVELHRGTVQARSAGVGKGAEFTVRLPALPPAVDSGVAAGQ